MITIDRVHKEYKVVHRKGMFRTTTTQCTALKDINLKLDSSGIIGLVGNNGAGKTTLMKLICGLIQPTAGDITVLGEIPFQKNHSLLRRLSFLSGRKDSLIWDLPVSDSLNFHGEIYKINRAQTLSRYKYLAELFDATHLLEKQGRALSLGERMKCELIKSLLHNPEILLLDEPTIGLDLTTQLAFRKYIKLANQQDKSLILLSSHNMDDISDTCTKMIGLSNGKVVFNDDIRQVSISDEIKAEYRIRYEHKGTQLLHEQLCSINEISDHLSRLTSKNDVVILSIEKNTKTFSQAIEKIITKNPEHA